MLDCVASCRVRHHPRATWTGDSRHQLHRPHRLRRATDSARSADSARPTDSARTADSARSTDSTSSADSTRPTKVAASSTARWQLRRAVAAPDVVAVTVANVRVAIEIVVVG